jgi:hypothetical protein
MAFHLKRSARGLEQQLWGHDRYRYQMAHAADARRAGFILCLDAARPCEVESVKLQNRPKQETSGFGDIEASRLHFVSTANDVLRRLVVADPLIDDLSQ